MKEEFIKLLKSTNREGMENLLNFLEKSDFTKHLLVQDFTVIMKVDFRA